jgi:hypothetical protein
VWLGVVDLGYQKTIISTAQRTQFIADVGAYQTIPLISHKAKEHRTSSLSALREVTTSAETTVILGAAGLINPNGSPNLTELCRGLQKKYRDNFV